LGAPNLHNLQHVARQDLRNSRDELCRDFGVESIALFGSAARGDAGPSSDIDILVEVPVPISLFRLVALRLRLQELVNGAKIYRRSSRRFGG